MHISMIPYAEHVILERALPRVEDGLKPVQRRILFTHAASWALRRISRTESARASSAIVWANTIRMATARFTTRWCAWRSHSACARLLVDGHGNFGSIDGDSAAAMRYTEARMAPLALEMLRDIDKDTVPFSLNFDDTLKEPDMLPARYPNLLVNGASGIAVGLATNIPPHNLEEAD